MQFDWTTFLLEMVNFLVLVWLLKRFFYRPVRAAIEARQAGIRKTLADARETRTAADALKAEYEGRLEADAEERRKAMEALTAEVAAERDRRMAALEAELGQARQKAEALAARERARLAQRADAAALARAERFLEKLLGGLAGPELDRSLLELFLARLPELAQDAQETLRKAWRDPSLRPVLSTAFAVDGATRDRVAQALERMLGRPGVPLAWREDPALLAGARLEVGGWAACADLHDELAFFQEVARERP